MITLFKLLSMLPLWLLHGAGWGLGWLVFVVSATYRKRFVLNARQAGLSARDWLPAVGESGKLVAELPKLWLGRSVTLDLGWRCAGPRAGGAQAWPWHRFFDTPSGVFEITAQAYAQRFGKTDKPMTVLFRPPRQAWLRALVEQSRQRPGLLTAPTTLSGVKQMIKALKGGESVGLLPDQVPPQGMA